MTSTFAKYDELLHQIYEAALQPAHWNSALGSLTEIFNGSRSLLFTPVHSPSKGGFSFAHNISQQTLERWAASGIDDDPMVAAGFRRGLFVDGFAVNGRDLVTDEELFKSRLYREVWAPTDIGHVSCGVVFAGTDSHGLPTVAAVYRQLQASPFSQEHTALMRRVLGHMSRSLGVMFHLRDAQLQVASTLAALDRFPSGVILLSSKGEVVFANRSAQRMVELGSLITTRAQGLSLRRTLKLADRLHHLEGAFQSALTSALAPLSAAECDHFSESLVLPNVEGGPSCVIHAAPLATGSSFSAGGDDTRAIVFIYDISNASTVKPELLCRLFGMSNAEALAALQVVLGGTNEEKAARLGVSINTFKTQMTAAFSKSSTSRHADLLKLLLALSAE